MLRVLWPHVSRIQILKFKARIQVWVDVSTVWPHGQCYDSKAPPCGWRPPLHHWFLLHYVIVLKNHTRVGLALDTHVRHLHFILIRFRLEVLSWIYVWICQISLQQRFSGCGNQKWFGFQHLSHLHAVIVYLYVNMMPLLVVASLRETQWAIIKA